MNTQDILDGRTLGPKDLWCEQAQEYPANSASRESGDAYGRECVGLFACPTADLEETIALYRLLDEDDVSFEALMQPHWHQTREQIASKPLVLLVQDTTEVDLSHHPKTKGLGEARQRVRTRAVSADGAGCAARER
jgi:hypothetical protein